MKQIKRLWASIFIPKNTLYCYTPKKRQNALKDGVYRIKTCRYWERLKEKDEHGYPMYYCKYLKLKDSYMGDSLLWDQCKECGINDDIE